MNQNNDAHTFEVLLDYLKRTRGFDFTGYKRTTLVRRIDKRMNQVGIQGYTDYIDFLEVHPDEFIQLFNTILINVTNFFRDQDAWDFLEKNVLPKLVSAKHDGDPIRVWSAGSASGEEAYSVAMLLAEILGEERFRQQVKIYATDIDEDALSKARLAVYSEKEIKSVPERLLGKYFECQNDHYTVSKGLRRAVIFGRHDLIQDAPISRVDLLICRNILMYFNAETQSKVLARLHFAVNDGGYVFLGKAEMLLTYGDLFSPVDLRERIFTRHSKISLRDRLMVMAQTGSQEAANHLDSQVRLREAAFDTGPVPQIIIENNGLMALANDHARANFSLSTRDIGQPFQDLQLSYRPVELRASIEEASSTRATVFLKDIEWTNPTGERRYLDIQVIPLGDQNGGLLGTGITFFDTTYHKRLQQQLEHTNQELETALEELQSTNEELETTNEELQSTIEELETTNEELQSTNEELETMNEELQSTNEEMETLNEELHRRTDDLNQVNVFLESIMASLRGGFVVLDRDMHVLVWNQRSEDLWGLRSEEVRGRHFFNLDIGLPIDLLNKPIRAVISGEDPGEETILDARNRRGKDFRCKVTYAPLYGIDRTVRGVILVMEDGLV